MMATTSEHLMSFKIFCGTKLVVAGTVVGTSDLVASSFIQPHSVGSITGGSGSKVALCIAV